MRLATRYRWSIFLGKGLGKLKRKLEKAAPRFELGIKDLQSSALPLGHAAEEKSSYPFADSISQGRDCALFLCNGHGEDLITARIIYALHKEEPSLPIEVLPLVGKGKAFDKAIAEGWLVRIGPLISLPSGGFSNQSLKGLIADIFSGLLSGLWKQFRYVRWARSHGRLIIAVGDLFPLLLAWSSGSPFAFIGTPKSDYTWTSLRQNKAWSDYYHRFKGTEWDPWEKFFMESARCRFVAVRDKLTARCLDLKGVPVYFPGNPMMDGFLNNECPSEFKKYKKLMLLCGSRMPEAIHNLVNLMNAFERKTVAIPIIIFIALGPDPSIDEVELCLKELGYRESFRKISNVGANSSWEKGSVIILIGVGQFYRWANWVDIGLANAGTATEQLVGLGVPCLSLPGDGPQFKYSFALRQSRLLGGAVLPCKTAEILSDKLDQLLFDNFLRQRMGRVGQKRMGIQGGGKGLAELILKRLF